MSHRFNERNKTLFPRGLWLFLWRQIRNLGQFLSKILIIIDPMYLSGKFKNYNLNNWIYFVFLCSVCVLSSYYTTFPGLSLHIEKLIPLAALPGFKWPNYVNQWQHVLVHLSLYVNPNDALKHVRRVWETLLTMTYRLIYYLCCYSRHVKLLSSPLNGGICHMQLNVSGDEQCLFSYDWKNKLLWPDLQKILNQFSNPSISC